jgi:hypothetical protein
VSSDELELIRRPLGALFSSSVKNHQKSRNGAVTFAAEENTQHSSLSKVIESERAWNESVYVGARQPGTEWRTSYQRIRKARKGSGFLFCFFPFYCLLRCEGYTSVLLWGSFCVAFENWIRNPGSH